jgi:pimeloyl-ACP methyl ester carboxylesterase
VAGQAAAAEADGWAKTNGIRLHYRAAGEGPVVLLLHGFPEFSYSWRYQLSALAAAGYRAVAPDLRGWGQTDKPRGVDGYTVPTLMQDLLGLVRHLGVEQIHLVGHDWGGVLAWFLAHHHPHIVQSVTVLNAPHPAGYTQVLRSHPSQLLRSWYVLFFQLPWVPEWCLRMGRAWLIRDALRRSSRPGTFTEADLGTYAANALQPYALTAGVNYYRALLRQGWPKEMVEYPHKACVIWGERDPFLVEANAESARPWVPQLAVYRLPQAGHWVQNEDAEAVSRILVSFLYKA